jgi:hypothetical protein
MFCVQSTPDSSVAEHYGLRNTTCLYSEYVASGEEIYFCEFDLVPVFLLGVVKQLGQPAQSWRGISSGQMWTLAGTPDKYERSTQNIFRSNVDSSWNT